MDGSRTQLRTDFYACMTARVDALFELTDAVLCTDGPVRTLVGLSLPPEHRRGHGASYDALNKGWIEVERLRGVLTGCRYRGVREGGWSWPWTSAPGCARTPPPAPTGCSVTSMAAARTRPS
nr:transposase [Nonomuraea solani]